jgi:hypothetical protein
MGLSLWMSNFGKANYFSKITPLVGKKYGVGPSTFWFMAF